MPDRIQAVIRLTFERRDRRAEKRRGNRRTLCASARPLRSNSSGCSEVRRCSRAAVHALHSSPIRKSNNSGRDSGMLHTVVMAGGSGTRFWPVSRKELPKQFLTLFGEQSLIQQAVRRCGELSAADSTWIVTNAAHAVETGRQLPELSADHILIEPCGRNTAPCIAIAAARLLAADPDAIMLVTPADHVITPNEAFVAAVQRAMDTVQKDPSRLCLFGILPDRPATGYGYIEQGDELPDGDRVFDVARFREKPNLELSLEQRHLRLASGHDPGSSETAQPWRDRRSRPLPRTRRHGRMVSGS
jgi:hypothetical protein